MTSYKLPPQQFGLCIDGIYVFLAGRDPGYILMGPKHRPVPMVDPHCEPFDELEKLGNMEGPNMPDFDESAYIRAICNPDGDEQWMDVLDMLPEG